MERIFAFHNNTTILIIGLITISVINTIVSILIMSVLFKVKNYMKDIVKSKYNRDTMLIDIRALFNSFMSQFGTFTKQFYIHFNSKMKRSIDNDKNAAKKGLFSQKKTSTWRNDKTSDQRDKTPSWRKPTSDITKKKYQYEKTEGTTVTI